VLAVIMALLAQFRLANAQQLRVDRAVCFVATAAILQYRRVLPEERTAALGVATVAIVIQGRLNELLGIGRAMRIMATGASHFAFAEWHVRRALQLSATHLMALQTEFRLLGLQ
jgi:hypothetical protein